MPYADHYKLHAHHQQSHPCMQKSAPNAAASVLQSSVLREMSQLVDAALSQAPATCDSLAVGHAASLPATSQQAVHAHGSIAAMATAHPDSGAGQSRDGETLPDASAAQKITAQAASAGKVGAGATECLSSSHSSKAVGSKKVNKPAWALTADAAKDAEQQEEEDLLAFAGGLEFEKYIDEQEDAEVRTALQVLFRLLPICRLTFLIHVMVFCYQDIALVLGFHLVVDSVYAVAETAHVVRQAETHQLEHQTVMTTVKDRTCADKKPQSLQPFLRLD